MCQLLGMNCNVPTDICFSFEGFHRRGGATDDHADGWGIAFFEGPGCRLFLDSKSAVQSPIAELVRTYPIHSMNVIAHIRRATRGKVALENTHPFVRELWGRHWVFAHNGTLRTVRRHKLGRFRPIGTTDSEHAFCALLTALDHDFRDYPRSPDVLADAIAAHAKKIGSEGTFNMLLGDGTQLYARCATKLHYIIRKAPFSKATLCTRCLRSSACSFSSAQCRIIPAR